MLKENPGKGSSVAATTTTTSNKADQAWRSICLAHGVRCFCTRSWKFFLPLFLSRSCGGSLRPTAAMTLAHNLAVATLSTTAAHLYRNSGSSSDGSTTTTTTTTTSSNKTSFFRAMLLENVSLVGLGVLMASFGFHAQSQALEEASVYSDSCERPFASPLFVGAIVFGCIDAVCFNLLSTVITKEWVATLYYKKNDDTVKDTNKDTNSKDNNKDNSSTNLAAANARLTQIDLLTATLCRLVVSTLVSNIGDQMVVLFLVLQHAVGALIIVTNIQRALRLQPHLAFAASTSSSSTSTSTSLTKPSVLQINPFHIFYDQTVPSRSKMLTLSHVLLYGTILAPGAVLNAYLHSQVPARTIAWFGTGANLLGALATILTPPLIATLDTYRVCLLAQFFQTGCVLLAAFSFYHVPASDTQSHTTSWLFVGGFLLPIVASRLGFWTFDLAERQIMQGTIPRETQTLYLTTERGLTQLVSLTMMCLCYVFSHPDSFGILVNISALAIASASVLLGLSSQVAATVQY